MNTSLKQENHEAWDATTMLKHGTRNGRIHASVRIALFHPLRGGRGIRDLVYIP